MKKRAVVLFSEQPSIEKFQETFVKNLPTVSCIYCCEHLISHKVYVGQAFNLKARVKSHLYHAQEGQKTKFYSAVRRHGVSEFCWYILQEAPRDQLNDLEVLWIRKLGAKENGYNLIDGGGHAATTKGTKWMYKESFSKMVPKSEVAGFLARGWKLGRNPLPSVPFRCLSPQKIIIKKEPQREPSKAKKEKTDWSQGYFWMTDGVHNARVPKSHSGREQALTDKGWRRGKTTNFPEESKQKISAANKKRVRTPREIERFRVAVQSEAFREKRRQAQTGRRPSEESRRKRSETAKNWWNSLSEEERDRRRERIRLGKERKKFLK